MENHKHSFKNVLKRLQLLLLHNAGPSTIPATSDLGSAATLGSKRINPRPWSCLCLAWS